MRRSLFDQSKRRARKGDPETSKKAARSSKTAAAHAREMTFDAIRRHPNKTTAELALLDNIRDPRFYGRRMTDLLQKEQIERAGVRKCAVTGHEAETWRPL